MLTHKEKLEIIRRSFFNNSPTYSHEAVNVLLEEISLLEAEVERLKTYTDQRLFAAACGVLQAWDEYAANDYRDFIEAFEEEGFYTQLSEAVAWWDSLPFDPAKDAEKLPKYEE